MDNKEFTAKPVYFASKTVGYGTFQVGFGVLIFSLVLLYLKWHWGRRRLYSAASKANGPFAWPFIGNALAFIGDNERLLNAVNSFADNYVSPVRIWLGPKLVFGFNTPEDLEIILSSPKALKKEDVYQYAFPYFGHGLTTAPVSIWKNHRKMIAPSFNQKILDSFVDVMSENANIFVDIVRKDLKMSKNAKLDIFDLVNRCSVDIIVETTMGIKLNSQTDDKPNITHDIDRASQIIFQRMFKYWLHSDFIFNMTTLAAEQKYLIEKLNKFTHEVVFAKKKEYQANKRYMEEYPEAELGTRTGKGRKVFLDFLIEQTDFTDEELQDEVLTFLAGGSDTSSTTDAFVFMCLGMHPDVQRKVYEEVMDVIGPSRDLVVEDLQQLTYLERVIKETMRFFPIVPNIGRKITEDLEVNNKFVLPAGSAVLVPIFHIHHNDKYWPDPWKFDPDRYLPEATSKRHSHAYLPFSAGPRNCIGMKFAYMSMKTVVAVAVRTFRFESDYKDIKEVRCRQDLALKPVLGFKVRMYER